MDKMPETQIVAKSSELVEARYKLSVNQHRLIHALISNIHPNDKEFTVYSYKISDICKLLKLSKKSLGERRRLFQDILNGLQQNLIEMIYMENGRVILKTPAWIEAPVFDWDADIISLRISETLRPYLLELREKGRFASYRIRDIVNFRCEYSFRLLAFCRNFKPRRDFHDAVIRNRFVKKVVYSLSELRRILGISAEQYSRPYNFIQKVLVPAQNEIHKHTSAYFEYRILKTGRQTTGIEFIFFGNMVPVQKAALSEHQKSQRNRARKLGCSLGFATGFIVKFSHKPDDTWQAIMAVEEYAEWLDNKGEKLKFPASALKKALFEGWYSRRWEERRQRELEHEMTMAEAKNRLELEKALERLAERKQEAEKIRENNFRIEEDRQKDKYNKQLEKWSNAYNGLSMEERAEFVLEVLPAELMSELTPENRNKVAQTVSRFVKQGKHDFGTVYEAGFLLLLEMNLP